jgi:F0F1-type ATP synthase assembly protein I
MNSKDPEENERFEEEKQAAKSYARYTGIGFQMIAVIGLFTFIGYKIDQSRDSSQPLYTAILSLTGVCIALYQVVRSLRNKR